MKDTLNRFLQLTPYFLTAAIIGALVFAWVPVLTGRSDIADILGRKIVETGGYPDNAASVIGWTLHIAIAVAYVKVYALLIALPGFPRDTGPRLLAGLVVAVIVGWLTTWLANPAISVAVSLLSGQGWPAELAPVYFKLGLPLWNHLGFFAIAWLVVVVVPALVQSAGQTRPAPRQATPRQARTA